MTAALLTFGGAYGNLAALDALLRWAQQRGLGAADIVFTGDWAAYCADGAAVTARAREELAGARMVRGNCERALAEDAEDCGCGFAPGSACAVLSDAWFRHARETIDLDARKWMGVAATAPGFCFRRAADCDNATRGRKRTMNSFFRRRRKRINCVICKRWTQRG